jgi:hypothetical protein
MRRQYGTRASAGDPQHRDGPAIVSVFLLRVRRQLGLRASISGGDQARHSCRLKATDICAGEPGRAARRLVDGGFTERYDYTLQGIGDVPYGKWREYDPEDTMRFYALRMNEVGMIKSTPNQLIAQGTDWRFLNELKRELKA